MNSRQHMNQIKSIAIAALPVDEHIRVMRHRIQGKYPGKRICIVTGTHGDELEGQYVCYKLGEILQANSHLLHGTVDIYPALNPMGIDSIQRGVPGFDLDMNRIFPGNAGGSLTESLAHKIINDMKGADFAIDIHASNIFLRELPQVRINVNTADTLVPYAQLLNVDLIWIHEAATVLESTLAWSLNDIGVKTLVVEMGVGMRITPEYGDRLVEGIFNLMRHEGMWDGIAPDIRYHPLIVPSDGVSFLNADVSGVFIPSISYNMNVRRGDEIGRIVSSLEGKVLCRVSAPCDGLVMTIRAYPIVYEGSLLARIYNR